MTHFCTLFDKNYLSRGLALHESLTQQTSDFLMFILCLDDFTYTYLKRQSLTNVALISIAELEKSDRELAHCRNNRELVEYYFTISPCLPLYLLKKYPSIPSICSIDADLYFYQNPIDLLKPFADYSVLITSHNFSPDISKNWYEIGIYNVSFQAFRNDSVGLACLEYWRKNCINWCCNHYDARNDRFANQKYLEKWTTLYGDKLIILETETSNLAIWNVNKFTLSSSKKGIFSNNQPIVFYHFSNVKIVNDYMVQCGFYWSQTEATCVLCHDIYLPYIKKIGQFNTQIFGTTADPSFQKEPTKSLGLIRRVMQDRALLLVWMPVKAAVYLDFSWINDTYRAIRSFFAQSKKEHYPSPQSILTYQKNEK